MKVTALICTHGDPAWAELAVSRAYPSTLEQGFFDSICLHDDRATLAEIRNDAAKWAVASDVLVFLDADDELAPGYHAAMQRTLWLESQYVPDLEPLLLVPAVSYVHPDGRETPPAIPQRGRWPRLNECVIGTAVSRRLFLDVGGFRELPSLEDYDLWLRCFDAGARLAYVPDAVYRAHVNPRGGRNGDQSPYDSIWAEHLARVSA